MKQETHIEKNFELTSAKHDPVHCLAPGLFRSFKRGERKNIRLDITYKPNSNETYKFIGYQALGADDMRLLQFLIAMANQNGVILESKPPQKTSQHHIVGLSSNARTDLVNGDNIIARKEGAKYDKVLISCSILQLLEESGLVNSGENSRIIKESLRRMSNVTLIHIKDKVETSYDLLKYRLDENTDKLHIALNPQLTDVIFGKNKKFTFIDLDEVRYLKTDVTRLIHQKLCGWIDIGKTGNINIDTLCEYVWIDKTNTTNAQNKRRAKIKKALKELESIGWLTVENKKTNGQSCDDIFDTRT
jgi:ribosomal protein S19E (S16A)